MKYNRPLQDGDSFELRDSVPMSHVCCDCGLVHDWYVRHTKGARVTVVTTTRNNRATGQRRRKSELQQEIEQLKICRDHWKLSYEALRFGGQNSKELEAIHEPRRP